MAKDLKAFLKIKREKPLYRSICERIKDYKQVNIARTDDKNKEQSSRCMDCGTPFCHWACPIGNFIPEWNDFTALGHWNKAFELLDAINTLPEITGRVCPALCEAACVLGINDKPITICENELGIIEYAFKHKLIKPQIPKNRTGKKIAVIGSGPAGLSCAARLNKFGHKVIVYERDEKIGGILRFGIPDFKLEKKIIDRRISLYEQEGIEFKTGINVGVDLAVEKIIDNYDAVILCGGAKAPRDLKIEGRDLTGIHFAMDYLTQSNRKISGEKISADKIIDAKNKKVLIIGGGDTGSDCVGTAHRQGAVCVIQVEVMPKPSESRTIEHLWPKYPLILRTSSSHEEGGQRHWCVQTKKFIGENNAVKKVICAKKETPHSEFEIEADLVILAIGFVHPEHNGLLEKLKVELDNRGNVKTDTNFMTSKKGVFACGDMRRGQSLVVWAMSEGYQAATAVNSALTFSK